MKILFLSTIYPTPAEPAKGVFNRHLVRALAETNEVAVIAPIPWTVDRPWRPTPGLQRSRSHVLDGLQVEYPRYYYTPRVLRTLTDWFYWRSVKPSATRLLLGFDPDLVLSYWAHPDGAVGNRIAGLTGARSAVIVGGSDVLIDTRREPQRDRIRAVLQGADAVLSVSDDLRGRVTDLGVAPERAFLWRQGVDSDQFRPGNQMEARERLGIAGDHPTLVWAGRMVPVKGLDILVRACRRLADWQPDFRLYLVGDGPERAVLQAECKTLASRIVFVGSRAQDELADWYRAADLVVLPSRSEGLPNVLRESITCATPFVASRVGGIAEIADERLDRLVPPEDPEALARAIAASLAERHKRPRRNYRTLNWLESAEQLLRLVNSVPRRSAVPFVQESNTLSAASR